MRVRVQGRSILLGLLGAGWKFGHGLASLVVV